MNLPLVAFNDDAEQYAAVDVSQPVPDMVAILAAIVAGAQK